MTKNTTSQLRGASSLPPRFIERTCDEATTYASGEDEDTALDSAADEPWEQQQPPEARPTKRSRPEHASSAKQGEEDACDEEHEREGPARQQAGSKLGREEDWQASRYKGPTPSSAQGGARKPQVSQERLDQLAKARERALQVRRERGELRRKEKALKELAFEARRKRLNDLEERLGRELSGHTKTVPSATPIADTKAKKKQFTLAEADTPSEVPTAPEQAPVSAVDKPARVAPVAVKPINQQAADELRREEELAAMNLYRQRVDEAKRQMLMQAMFGN